MGSTTPLWVPLVVAVLGVLGTVVAGVSGVVITQRWSDRREARTAEREGQREKERWERERQREREVWVREDAARTFDLRRQAYVDFHQAVRADYREFLGVASLAGEVRDDSPPTVSSLERVKVYGSEEVATLAEDTCYVLDRVRSDFRASRSSMDEVLAEIRPKRDELLRAIRADLGVPAGAIEPAPVRAPVKAG